MAIIIRPADVEPQAARDRRRAAGAWAVVIILVLAAYRFEYTGLIGWWLR